MKVHEKIADQYIAHPISTATAYWGNGAPLDPHIAMLLASNAAHLSSESYRQLVWDASATSYTTAGKTAGTWDGLIDAPGPDLTTLSGATDSVSWVSWAPGFTRRYGPNIAVCDRDTSTGTLTMRRVRGQVRWSGSGGGTGASVTALHCALTTHRSPLALSQGDYVSYEKFTIPAAGAFTQTVDLDWEPSVYDLQSEPLICRAGSSGAIGSTRIGVTLFWIWLCVNAPNGASIDSASFWEAP